MDNLKPIVKNITSKILYELFKIKIPLTIIFVDENNQENLDYRIKIEDRIFDKNENIPLVRLGTNKSLFKDKYDRLLTLIDMHVNEGYKYGVFSTTKNILEKQKLLDLLGTINSELISICTYIDYNNKNNYFELKNKPLNNGNPDEIYYFEKDNSILQFDNDGPSLFVSDVVNNITDIICD